MLSANQKYKQSGSSLPFKEWLNREKAKGVVVPQKGVTDVYLGFTNETNETVENKEKKETTNSKDVFGLNRNILAISTVIVLGALAYKFYVDNK